MASLRELQYSFAAALRDPAASVAVVPPANLAIYRSTAAHNFRSVLESTFRVIRQRVGDDYFRQLAHHYRERFPSRSGDLHFVGQNFAAFLAEHLHGSDYAWLADLAHIEWSREEALVSPEVPGVGAEVLSNFTPEQLEDLVASFQPSLRLHSSAYPVFSIWLANQAGIGAPVDQSIGSEAGLVRIRHGLLEVQALEPRLYSCLYALAAGQTLGEAMELSDFDEASLLGALGFVFTAGLVTGVSLQSGTRLPNA